jgi:hypothetical protein
MDQARIHPCPHDDGYLYTQGIHHRVCSGFVFLWQLSLTTYLPLLYLFTCRNMTDSNIRTFAGVVGAAFSAVSRLAFYRRRRQLLIAT